MTIAKCLVPVLLTLIALPLPAQQMSISTRMQLGNITGLLDRAEKSIEAGDLRQAGVDLGGARRRWGQFQQRHKGRYDPADPEVVAVQKKLETVAQRIEGDAASAASMTESLGPLMETLQENEASLKEARKEARMSFMAFTSKMSDYARLRNPKVFDGPAQRAARAVDSVNGILPGACAAAAALSEQYPDRSALERLVKDGRAAVQLLERLEALPEKWAAERRRVAEELIAEVEKSIGQERDALKARADAAPQVKKGLADDAEVATVVPSQIYLRFVRSLYPESPVTQNVPGHDDGKKTLARALAAESSLVDLAKAIATLRGQAEDEKKLRLASARFPTTSLQGEKWAEATAILSELYRKFAPDRKILRVAISSDYDTRTEARWVRDHWDVGTFRYLGGVICSELPGGSCRVYRISFRQRRGDGGFSPLEIFGIGSSYEILAENVSE